MLKPYFKQTAFFFNGQLVPYCSSRSDVPLLLDEEEAQTQIASGDTFDSLLSFIKENPNICLFYDCRNRSKGNVIYLGSNNDIAWKEWEEENNEWEYKIEFIDPPRKISMNEIFECDYKRVLQLFKENNCDIAKVFGDS